MSTGGKNKIKQANRDENAASNMKEKPQEAPLTFSKWQIIDFYHACKHCISIEMVCFWVSNR